MRVNRWGTGNYCAKSWKFFTARRIKISRARRRKQTRKSRVSLCSRSSSSCCVKWAGSDLIDWWSATCSAAKSWVCTRLAAGANWTFGNFSRDYFEQSEPTEVWDRYYPMSTLFSRCRPPSTALGKWVSSTDIEKCSHPISSFFESAGGHYNKQMISCLQ